MTPAEYKKSASKGPYKGLPRSEIFKLKVRNKSPFTLNNNQKVKGTKWDEDTLTLYVGTKKIHLKEIKKDSDMGGGGGSGAGADLTAVTESGQCFVSSLVYNVLRKNIKWEDLTLENLQEAAKYCYTTISLDEVIEKSPADWVQSYIKAANSMFTNYKLQTPVYCHRGSAFVDKIYAAKKQVFDNDKNSDNQQAPGSFSNDKWNPADIWITRLRELPDLPTDSWSSLNKEIYDLAVDKKVLGISLKKLGPVAKFEENNVPKKQNSQYRYESFRVSSLTERTGKLPPFFNSIDLYMKISGKEIQFRATSGEAGWQGEIKGETAAGGKIGGGNVNFYLQKFTGKSLWTRSEDEIMQFTKSKDFFPEFYRLYQENFKGDKIQYDDFVAYAQEKQKDAKGYLFSKYMNMKFIDIFLNQRPDVRNKIAAAFFNYAASNTDQSSYFVKIY